jgi:hypothetical protein
MPTKGTPKQTIRVDPDLWARFGDAVGDRAHAIRAFMSWTLREEGGKLPKRPPARGRDDE